MSTDREVGGGTKGQEMMFFSSFLFIFCLVVSTAFSCKQIIVILANIIFNLIFGSRLNYDK
jgi:hypothetical protein